MLYSGLQMKMEYIEDLEIEVNDGLLFFLIEPKGKKSYMCFEYSYVEQVKKSTSSFLSSNSTNGNKRYK